MYTENFTAAMNTAIDTFENTAHHLIAAYREGGERLAQAADQRWASAFKEAAPQLTAETRKNATHAKKVFAGYYNKALNLSASGAEVAVDTLAQAAATAVERAAAYKQARA